MLREKSKERRRRAILDAAAKMLGERSYDAVLLEDVAAAAEVAKGTVYLYFDSKEHLYLTLVRESLQPLLEDLQRHQAEQESQPAWDALKYIIARLLMFSTDHPSLKEVLRVTTQVSREAVLQEWLEQLTAHLEKTIERGIVRGEFNPADPRIAAQMILGMVNKCGLITAKLHNRESAEKVSEQVLQLIAHGLIPCEVPAKKTSRNKAMNVG